MAATLDNLAKLELLKKEIFQEAEAASQQTVGDAENKKNQLIEEGKKKVEQEFKEELSKKRQDVEKETMRKMAAINLEASMKKLRSKAALMQQAVDDAKRELESIRRGENYPDYLKALILEAVLELKEEDIEVYIDARDEKVITKDFLSSIEIILTFTYSLVVKLEIANERITTAGGVVIRARNKNVLCNNTFEERMNLFDGTFRQLIAQELFK